MVSEVHQNNFMPGQEGHVQEIPFGEIHHGVLIWPIKHALGAGAPTGWNKPGEGRSKPPVECDVAQPAVVSHGDLAVNVVPGQPCQNRAECNGGWR